MSTTIATSSWIIEPIVAPCRLTCTMTNKHGENKGVITVVVYRVDGELLGENDDAAENVKDADLRERLEAAVRRMQASLSEYEGFPSELSSILRGRLVETNNADKESYDVLVTVRGIDMPRCTVENACYHIIRAAKGNDGNMRLIYD